MFKKFMNYVFVLLFCVGCGTGNIRKYADDQIHLTSSQRELIAQRIPYIGMDAHHLNAMYGRHFIVSSHVSEFGVDQIVRYNFPEIWVRVRNDKVVSWGR